MNTQKFVQYRIARVKVFIFVENTLSVQLKDCSPNDLLISQGNEVLDCEVENLYSTEDGETSEEAHCSSNDGYLSLKSVLCVFLNEVECRCVEIDANHFHLGNLECLSWIIDNDTTPRIVTHADKSEV